MKMAVTGLGLISAAGAGPEETLASFHEGRRQGGPVSLFKTEVDVPVYEAGNFSRHYFSPRLRTMNLCLAAVEDALSCSEARDGLRGRRVGVALGTTVGSILNDLDFYREYRARGSASMTAVDQYLSGNLAAMVHSFLKAEGPGLTVVNACASGADAIGIGMSWLRAGLCDAAIVGGADEMNRVPLCGFGSLGILSPSLCAPFDRDRSGLNLGEGAGVLVLEPEASARARGAKIRGFVSGYGTSNDAYHLTAPEPSGSGLERAVNSALWEAGVKPDEITFVNAHGTATRDNDQVEGLVLKRLFGSSLKFLSTKGYTGHTLGAAGGIEACFTLLGLEQGWIPASAGFLNEDPALGLSPVTERTQIAGRFALSTSLGFGGCDAALVLEGA